MTETSDTSTTASAEKVAVALKPCNGTGEGYIFRVSPPFPGYQWAADDSDKEPTTYEHVWVHGANIPYSGPETYIFGCDEEGKVLDWSELDGSFRGSIDHERALHGAGYAVVWGDLR